MTKEIHGMRELSAEELTIISGGDGPPTDGNGVVGTLPGAPPPDLTGIAQFGWELSGVAPGYTGTPWYVESDENGSRWCTDTEDGEYVCMPYGVNLISG